MASYVYSYICLSIETKMCIIEETGFRVGCFIGYFYLLPTKKVIPMSRFAKPVIIKTYCRRNELKVGCFVGFYHHHVKMNALLHCYPLFESGIKLITFAFILILLSSNCC